MGRISKCIQQFMKKKRKANWKRKKLERRRKEVFWMILHPPHTYINMYIHKNTDRHDLHKKILSYSFFIDKLVNHILFDAWISSTYSILLRYWLLDDGRTVCVRLLPPLCLLQTFILLLTFFILRAREDKISHQWTSGRVITTVFFYFSVYTWINSGPCVRKL